MASIVQNPNDQRICYWLRGFIPFSHILEFSRVFGNMQKCSLTVGRYLIWWTSFCHRFECMYFVRGQSRSASELVSNWFFFSFSFWWIFSHASLGGGPNFRRKQFTVRLVEFFSFVSNQKKKKSKSCNFLISV